MSVVFKLFAETLTIAGWTLMPTGAIPTPKNNNPNKTRPVLDRFHDSGKELLPDA